MLRLNIFTFKMEETFDLSIDINFKLSVNLFENTFKQRSFKNL